KRVRIGALARNSDVAEHDLIKSRYPVLSQALLSGASPQLRNMEPWAAIFCNGRVVIIFTILRSQHATNANPAAAVPHLRVTIVATRFSARANSASRPTLATCVSRWPPSTRWCAFTAQMVNERLLSVTFIVCRVTHPSGTQIWHLTN